jgi:hypothetical protein
MRNWVSFLAIVLIATVAVVLAGCDQVTRINITGPLAVATSPAPAPIPTPVVIVDVAPVDVTNLIGPPSDADVPFNQQEASSNPPQAPSNQPEAPSCEDKHTNGRGEGNGTPGNGKGQGDENGKGCR